MTKNYYYFIILLLIAIGVTVFSCANPNNGVTSKPAPKITNHTPIDVMTDVSIDTSITLEFDVLVIPASGTITLNAQGTTKITIPVTDTSQVTVVNKQVTISPSNGLAFNKTYTITIPEGAFKSELDEVSTDTETTFSFTTETILDPVIVTFSPSDNAMQVAITTPIVLNFNIPITAVTGDITIIANGEVPIIIPVDDNQVSISDEIVTITLSNALSFNQTYSISIPSGAFQNAASVPTATATTFSFTTETILDPIIVTVNPIENAAQVAITTPIVLNFNTPITAITGNNITITSTGEAPITIPVDDAQVSISDRIVTITPSSALSFNQTYSISIPAGAFQNILNVATTTATTFSFTTETILDPIIVTVNPTDNATQVAVTTPIVLNFNTPITPVTGNITITANGEAPITIPVDDAQVSISDRIVTITPSSALSFNQTYSISIPAGAFKNAASVPTATATNFSFTTVVVNPIIVTVNPTDNATQVAVTTPIVLNFNTPITPVTGNITITANGEAPITIPVDDAQVSISDKIVTITPSSILSFNQTYSISIPAGAFQNADSVPTATATNFSFTTTTGVFIHSLILENTNANPQNAINLAELEVYTNHTRQGINFATNTDNTITSGMVGNFEGPNVADRLIDGNRANVALTDLYHSFGTFATENWVKLSFDPPIFLNTNNNDTSLLEVVVYNRENRNNLQDRATNLTVHLYDASDTQIATFGIGLSLAEAQNDILSFPFDILFDPNTIPMIIGHTPTASATGVLISTPITLDFNIRVLPVASKNITLTPGSGSPITIATTDPQVRIIENTITVEPTSDLMFNKLYVVNIEAGALKSVHNIASTSSTFTFRTESPISPMVTSTSATDVLVNADNIILTFNTPITAVSGNNITLTPTVAGGTTVTIAVDDTTQVTIVDRIVTINPNVILYLGGYTFNVPAGAFKNSENMATTTPTTFSFTTILPFADFTLASGNTEAQRITFANNMFWVTDTTDGKVYAYNNIGASSSANNFNLDPENSASSGITFANNMFWVTDPIDDKVYAYDNTGASSSDNDFTIPLANGSARGIIFTNNMFWVINNFPSTTSTDKVFAYTSDGEPSSDNDFTLASGNKNPQDITFANNMFWIVDFDDKKVYAYTGTGTSSSADDFDLDEDNGLPFGITFADNKFWVVDSSDTKVYVYDINGNRP